MGKARFNTTMSGFYDGEYAVFAGHKRRGGWNDQHARRDTLAGARDVAKIAVEVTGCKWWHIVNLRTNSIVASYDDEEDS